MSLLLPNDSDGAAAAELPTVERALEMDFENIVRKAARGGVLTGAERELLVSRASPKTDEVLVLEDSALADLTQRQLAEAWGVSERSIKGWLALGRKAGDPAPVTRPADFPAWYARRHAPRDCPEKLLAAARRLMAGTPAPKSARVDAGGAGRGVRVEIAEEEKGMLAMLERHRNAEATLHAKYMEAVELGDETRTQFLLSEWSKMGEKLRQLEKAAPRALAELGIYVRRDDVQRELEPLLAAVVKGFRQALRLARPTLRATVDADAWNRATDEIVTGTCALLVESQFVEALELE